MYTIQWSPGSRRALNRLPPEVAAAIIEQIRGPIATNPHRLGKELAPPYEGTWTARRGEYRILYSIDEKTEAIQIKSIRHRRDAYRA